MRQGITRKFPGTVKGLLAGFDTLINTDEYSSHLPHIIQRYPDPINIPFVEPSCNIRSMLLILIQCYPADGQIIQLLTPISYRTTYKMVGGNHTPPN